MSVGIYQLSFLGDAFYHGRIQSVVLWESNQGGKMKNLEEVKAFLLSPKITSQLINVDQIGWAWHIVYPLVMSK